jgi:hypothetical protein
MTINLNVKNKVRSFETILKDLKTERYFSENIIKKIIKYQKIISSIGFLILMFAVPFFYISNTPNLKLLSLILVAFGNGVLLTVLTSLLYFSKNIKEYPKLHSYSMVYPVINWSTPITNIPEQSMPPYHISKMIIKKGDVLGLEWDGHNHCVFMEDTLITILTEGEKEIVDPSSVWMSDTPQEYFTHWNLVIRSKGPNILVVGLGLGLLVHLLSLRKDIKKIVIIDISPEIINMVSPYLPNTPEITVIKGDFFDVIFNLYNSGIDFNSIICDIWKGIDNASQEKYLKCRKTLQELYPNAVHLFWAFQTIYEQEVSSSFFAR